MSTLSETILVQIAAVAVVREPDGTVERLQVRVLPVGSKPPEVPAYTIPSLHDTSMLFEVPEVLGVNLRPGRYLAVDLRTCTPEENEKAARVATDVRATFHRELAEQRKQQEAMSGMVRGIANQYGVMPRMLPLTVVDDTCTGDAPCSVTPIHPLLRDT
jgi:hypothetical protein